jgi:hypothetical protein
MKYIGTEVQKQPGLVTVNSCSNCLHVVTTTCPATGEHHFCGYGLMGLDAKRTKRISNPDPTLTEDELFEQKQQWEDKHQTHSTLKCDHHARR